MNFIVKVVGNDVGTHPKVNQAIRHANELVDSGGDRIAITVRNRIPTLMAFMCNVSTDDIWTIVQQSRQVIVNTRYARGSGA